jgi:hypothetical protein
MAEKGKLVRTATGQFVAGQSGNPAGRPKGSKNKITEIKLLTEQAVRSGRLEDMVRVCENIIEDALDGDVRAKKMVWDAMMSKASSTEDKAAGTRQKIEIGVMHVDQPNVIEGEIVATTEEKSHE